MEAELRAELEETKAKLEALKAQKGSLSLLQNDLKEKTVEVERLRDQVSKERATSRANLQKVMRITSEKKVVEDALAQAQAQVASATATTAFDPTSLAGECSRSDLRPPSLALARLACARISARGALLRSAVSRTQTARFGG
jgi:SMC interacting uncharacterized protein involved in chromosome segregation